MIADTVPAFWAALALAILAWGAVLVWFSARIVRVVAGETPTGAGAHVLRVVATL